MSPTSRLGLALTVALALGLCSPTQLAASPFNVYGMGSRATAMGGAQGAAARNQSAIYYNPANLVQRQNTHFSASLNFIEPNFEVEHDNLFDEGDIVLPSTNASLALGFVFPLGGLIDYRIGIGFALSVPLIELTRLEAIDPQRPYFYVYQSLPDHLVLAPAIGGRITDWLRVGIGIQVLAELNAQLEVTGDLVRRRIEERSLTVDLDGTSGPVAGIAGTIGPVELAFTFRDALELNYEIPVLLLIEEVGPVDLNVEGTTLFSPQHFNFGVAVNIDEPQLVLAADLTLERWSNAPDPTASVTAILTDEELRPEAEDTQVLLEFLTPTLDLGAQNIWVPRFGVEWQATDVWAARAGFFHRPTPIPDQTGYTNFLDSPTNVYSLGGGATFADPLHVAEQPMSIDLHVQLTHVTPRITLKDEEAGATFEGAYRASGVVWNLGLEIRQDF